MTSSAKDRRQQRSGSESSGHDALVTALQTLDRLLGLAVDKTARMLGPATLMDPWRGMHLDAEEVKRVLRRERNAAVSVPDAADALASCLSGNAAAHFHRVDGLDAVDLAIIVIVLAPDIDLRYERIYAYLQDDVSRKRPTPDLIANLLCTSTLERLQLMQRFAANASLFKHGVLQWCGNVDNPDLARPVRIARAWLDVLARRDVAAHDSDTDATIEIERAAIDPEVAARVESLVQKATRFERPIRLVLQGPHGAGKYALARLIARAAAVSLHAVDIRDCTTADELRSTLRKAINEAAVRRALPYLHGAGRLHGRNPQLVRALQALLADTTIGFVLALKAPLPFVHGAAVTAERVDLGLPSAASRQRAWTVAFNQHAIAVSREDIETTALRFILSAAQIAQAAADVAQQVGDTGAKSASAADLAAAARRLCGDELALMAQRVRPVAGFESLVAAPEVQAQLREICARVALRERVRQCWIGDSVHARNVGVNALFAGPSGTGKTLAAEIIARELGLDLFRIDLSAVVSKYIGETEKNLDSVFAAAANANAVLFFDEADALFGKRSEVKDAHDRYANIEIAYLLQKIEQFDGVAILATNLKQNLDEAFTRRLTFCVNFAFPEEAERVRLWQTLWPASAGRASDVDFAALAREYRVSGGNIRNIVIASAYLAAADGQIVTREHVLHATRREFQKLGKTLAPVSAQPERRAA